MCLLWSGLTNVLVYGWPGDKLKVDLVDQFSVFLNKLAHLLVFSSLLRSINFLVGRFDFSGELADLCESQTFRQPEIAFPCAMFLTFVVSATYTASFISVNLLLNSYTVRGIGSNFFAVVKTACFPNVWQQWRLRHLVHKLLVLLYFWNKNYVSRSIWTRGLRPRLFHQSRLLNCSRGPRNSAS